MEIETDEQLELERDCEALAYVAEARVTFERDICRASASQDDGVLDELRQPQMYEFAEFYFTLQAMSLKGPDDGGHLADLHNERIDRLLRDKATIARRGLSERRLLDAMITADTRPRLEHIWREAPGALDQSNLARFLTTQMSVELTRRLAVACEAAGFVTRASHVSGATVVVSTGVMEGIFSQTLRRMRRRIAQIEEKSNA